MDEAQQEHLDEQVQQAMRELQADGEHPTVESVARKVGRRTEAVLHAVRRLTRGTPALDVDTPPHLYPEVVAAEHKVASIEAALREAEQTLTARETALAQAEAAVAEALIDGREPRSLSEARQAVLEAAEMCLLLELAETKAKERYDVALQEAQRQHWQIQWGHYQGAVRAFDEALSVAYTAQEEAMRLWNAIGQPQEAPLLKAPLAVWPDHFHQFLQQILNTAAEDVQRGTSVAGVNPQPRPY
jgi:hypothetical protein